MLLEINVAGITALARLDSDATPATCAALVDLLPVTGSVHYAKIAGEEIMLHLPLILEVEQATGVNALETSAVVFFPERQLFCVYYGHIQEEDAQVTLLGHVTDNLGGLIAAAEQIRRTQGYQWNHMQLALAENIDGTLQPKRATPRVAGIPVAARIMEAYYMHTERPPADVQTLVARRGVMRPGGALLYAEAETRKLHEVLWTLRRSMRREGKVPSFGRYILRHFAQRLRGWYGLQHAATLTEAAEEALATLPAQQATIVVEALAVYMGQLNLWLDSHIPWNTFNEVLQEIQERNSTD